MIKVNLLSPEKKEVARGGATGPEAPSFEEEREAGISKLAMIMAVVVTLGTIFWMYYSQDKVLTEMLQTRSEKQGQKAELDKVLKKISALEKVKKDLDRKVEIINDLKARQLDTVKMMDEMLNALPDWVWLTNLVFSNRSITLRGKTLGNNLISDFISNLKGTRCFYDVDFPGSNRTRSGSLDTFDFSITCKYKDKDQPEKPAPGKAKAKTPEKTTN